MNRFRARIVAICIFAVLLSLAIPRISVAQAAFVPFGGLAVFVSPCNSGHILMQVAPYGMFMFLKPPIIGAPWTLGLAGPAPIPCIFGIVSMGAGFPVLISN